MENNNTNEHAQELNQNQQLTQERLATLRKKSDLSDIILEKEHTNNDRKKKFFLGAASVLLLVLIIMIISKITTTDKTTQVQNDSNISEENITVKTQVDTVDTTDTITSTVTKTPVATTSKVTTTESETDSKFEEMVKRLRERDATEMSSDVVVPSKTEPVVTKEPVKIKAKNHEVTLATIKEISNATKVTTTPKKHTTPKKLTRTKKLQTSVPSFRNTLHSAKAGYYIQVGATTKARPGTTMANKISSAGFSYVTHGITIKGRVFNKILIGPFSSKNAAGAQLDRVKATINPQAFLYSIK